MGRQCWPLHHFLSSVALPSLLRPQPHLQAALVKPNPNPSLTLSRSLSLTLTLTLALTLTLTLTLQAVAGRAAQRVLARAPAGFGGGYARGHVMPGTSELGCVQVRANVRVRLTLTLRLP